MSTILNDSCDQPFISNNDSEPTNAGILRSTIKIILNGRQQQRTVKQVLNDVQNMILVDDHGELPPVYSIPLNNDVSLCDPIKYTGKEIIAGSSLMGLIKIYDKKQIPYDDVDIYFQTKKDADEFMKLNRTIGCVSSKDPFCRYTKAIVDGGKRVIKLNLIYGVPHRSVRHLIGRFDIRACAIAYTPKDHTFHYVEHALLDIVHREINYQLSMRGTTIKRLLKYTQKGFTIRPVQRLLLVELLPMKHVQSSELVALSQYGGA